MSGQIERRRSGARSFAEDVSGAIVSLLSEDAER